MNATPFPTSQNETLMYNSILSPITAPHRLYRRRRL
jgi:hypothetical protein